MMDGINTTMSAADKAAVDFAVSGYNKELGVKGRTVNHSLGKDDFLKLLIAQLSNQEVRSKTPSLSLRWRSFHRLNR